MEYRIEGQKIRFLLSDDCEGMTCGAFLEQWHLSKKARALMEMRRQIELDGQWIANREPLRAGAWLSLRVLQNEEVDFVPWEQPLKIVYEDELILAVSKPVGMIVHPDDKQKTGTLANAVAAYYLKSGQSCSVRYLHRLDEGTSGIVLFSKCPLFQPWLDQQLSEKKIGRTYLAVVSGVFRPHEKLTVDKPIGRDRHDARRQRISPTGQPAVTHLEVLKVYQPHRRSLLQCTLETGRTHQIRVHLASLGKPIINDPLYHPHPQAGRMMLHAWKCQWTDPLSGKRIEIEDEADPAFWKL